MRFRDKVALITGAGSGIGRATAQMMGEESGTIVGIDISQENIDFVTRSVRQSGGKAKGIVADALDAGQVTSVVQQTVNEFGRIDILVNAVGGSTFIANPGASVDELTLDDWQLLLHINLTGTFLFTNAVVPIMKRQNSGKVINLASIAGRGRSESSSSAYATAKGGIIAFTRKLAYELGPSGITCNAIAPSRTLTERINPRWEMLSEEEQQAQLARHPLRRLALPEDQARVICFLASSDADYVNGVTIDVTGGQ